MGVTGYGNLMKSSGLSTVERRVRGRYFVSPPTTMNLDTVQLPRERKRVETSQPSSMVLEGTRVFRMYPTAGFDTLVL